MALYSERDDWADVVPIALDEGGASPLAAIAYSDEYRDATAYLRAVMADDEKSGRVLELTERIIGMNPAHYTVWLYRAATLFALQSDLAAELTWLNAIALRHLKNYQIWQHRQMIVDKLGDPAGETAFIMQMLDQDAKNYHVWSYRQWLVRRFELDASGELQDVEILLKRDVRNNSAWNHRWFVVFGLAHPHQQAGSKSLPTDDIIAREIEYAQSAITLAPQNQSPWNYLRALYRHTSTPLSSSSSSSSSSSPSLEDFTTQFAPLSNLDAITSSHALDLLADIYAEQQKPDKASQVLDLLAQKYDPVRANYWAYKKSLLVPAAETGAEAQRAAAAEAAA